MIKKQILASFHQLKAGYEKLPPSVSEGLGVNSLIQSMEDGSFFELPSEKQESLLRRMVTLHVGRGEMFYRLEKEGEIDPTFWMSFKSAIEKYLEALVGKSYPFPDS